MALIYKALQNRKKTVWGVLRVHLITKYNNMIILPIIEWCIINRLRALQYDIKITTTGVHLYHVNKMQLWYMRITLLKTNTTPNYRALTFNGHKACCELLYRLSNRVIVFFWFTHLSYFRPQKDLRSFHIIIMESVNVIMLMLF